MFKKILQIVLAVLISTATLTALYAMEQKQTSEQEVRISLRVVRDGAVIDNLQKQDVELLIDDAPHAIFGWQNLKKMIGAPASGSQRFFVLIFHLNEYPEYLDPALSKLFQSILRGNDRLLVLVNQATLLIDNLSDREKSAAAVKDFVKEQAYRFRQSLDNDRNNLTKLIEKHINAYKRVTSNIRGAGIHRHYYMKLFYYNLNEYLSLMREYKQRCLLPAPGLFSGLCPQLAENRGQKWIIAFWQIPELPKLPRKSKEFIAALVPDYLDSTLVDENTYGALFMKWLKDVDIVYTSKSTFPGENIYNLFAGLESTVHAFYVPPRDKEAYKDTDFNQVTEQSKEILAGLAENTGGLFLTLTEPESDIAAIAANVDTYYVLNFPPISGKGKITIRMPDKKMLAWFDPFPADERKKECQVRNDLAEKQIELSDIVLQKRILAFKIVNFLKEALKKESKNRIFVHVSLKDGQGRKVFDQSRYFVPQKSEIAIRLELAGVPAGTYDIIIEIGESLTGKTKTRVLNAQLE